MLKFFSAVFSLGKAAIALLDRIMLATFDLGASSSTGHGQCPRCGGPAARTLGGGMILVTCPKCSPRSCACKGCRSPATVVMRGSAIVRRWPRVYAPCDFLTCTSCAEKIYRYRGRKTLGVMLLVAAGLVWFAFLMFDGILGFIALGGTLDEFNKLHGRSPDSVAFNSPLC